ncbi:MAG: DNA cytosine methyltransferase, partial [Sutterellaceae bacterium]|nr:DNA cytosine methyltransferase [Sutterellaceae bacterium]
MKVLSEKFHPDETYDRINLAEKVKHSYNPTSNLLHYKKMTHRTCIDLFSGAGGLSEGLSQAGFHSLYASEIIAPYANTYQKNHPTALVETADIR